MRNAPVYEYYLQDDGTFPNSHLPVLLYKMVLKLPPLLAGTYTRNLLRRNSWRNSWRYGIYEYNHYHSITHEVLAIVKGSARLLLGGNHGVTINIEKGDVVIIPAGVAHKNLGKEKDIVCIGAYPGGAAYDINYGYAGERPQADHNIRNVALPEKDPIFGSKGGIKKYWK